MITKANCNYDKEKVFDVAWSTDYPGNQSCFFGINCTSIDNTTVGYVIVTSNYSVSFVDH